MRTTLLTSSNVNLGTRCRANVFYILKNLPISAHESFVLDMLLQKKGNRLCAHNSPWYLHVWLCFKTNVILRFDLPRGLEREMYPGHCWYTVSPAFTWPQHWTVSHVALQYKLPVNKQTNI